MEVGIAKQLNLSPLDASIVTAGLQFKGKSSILRSLLTREKEKNETALKLVIAAQNIPDRNDIMHGVPGGNEWTLWFNRRKTDAKFSSKIEKYNTQRLNDLSIKCANLAADIQIELGISAEEFSKFFQDAHNAVNSRSASQPPLSVIWDAFSDSQFSKMRWPSAIAASVLLSSLTRASSLLSGI